MSRLSAAIGAALVLTGTAAVSHLGDLLFSVHMAQHLLLIAVASPLLVLAGVRVRVPPLAGWVLFVGIFLFWHWPAAFQWAAQDRLREIVEMSTILAATVCFWSGVLDTSWLNDGARALLVMTAAILTDLPGVVMLFSPRVICTMPSENAARFGLTPFGDQQLAGLLMWVPANLVFFAIATFLFARWIGFGAPRRPA
jgi:cytochrome c oxidase assembly factor CtaG